MTDDERTLAIVKALDRLGEEVRALRTTVAVIADAMVAAPLVTEPPETAECQHPEEARVSMASPGNEDFHCRACGQLIERPLVATEG